MSDNTIKTKTTVVASAIASDQALGASLELSENWMPARTHGWIADTSIDCNHQLFSGFLKISIEELLIALRDRFGAAIGGDTRQRWLTIAFTTDPARAG